MLKFFRLPFATTGDKTAVPDAVDVNGNVSYSQGYSFDYQRQKTDPAAKNIERDKMNQIFFDMTTAIAEIQSQGVPDFITTALNGGTPYSYDLYAVVKYSGELYVSLAAANTALPSDATKWALFPLPARLQSALNTRTTAGGTADALTGAFTPTITALPAAPDTLSVMVRAGSANATTTPSFKADGTAAKTIVKGANLALAPGDIAGAGHWLHLNYDPTLDKWVLLNPFQGKGALLNVQVITASGTYTPTPGTNSIIVEGIGGGGAGGGVPILGGGSIAAAGGGSCGAYGKKLILSGFAGATITIGAAGTGVAGGAGNNGGTTSFGALLTCPGGKGAPAGVIATGAYATGSPAAFSSAPTGADVGSRGAGGGIGATFSSTSGVSGDGGSTPLGSGGSGGIVNGTSAAADGTAAAGYGAGGGGALACGGTGTARSGGSGAPGIIIISEYA